MTPHHRNRILPPSPRPLNINNHHPQSPCRTPQTSNQIPNPQRPLNNDLTRTISPSKNQASPLVSIILSAASPLDLNHPSGNRSLPPTSSPYITRSRADEEAKKKKRTSHARHGATALLSAAAAAASDPLQRR